MSDAAVDANNGAGASSASSSDFPVSSLSSYLAAEALRAAEELRALNQVLDKNAGTAAESADGDSSSDSLALSSLVSRLSSCRAYRRRLAAQLANLDVIIQINSEEIKFCLHALHPPPVPSLPHFVVAPVPSGFSCPSVNSPQPNRRLLMADFFLDENFNKPPNNPDAEYKAQQRAIHNSCPPVIRQTFWTERERSALKLGVLRALKSQAWAKELAASLNSEPTNSLQDNQAQERIKHARIEDLLLECDLSSIDWAAIAHTEVATRTGRECETQWLQVDDPRINNGEWEKSELLRLREVAASFNFRNWFAIAEHLGSNRTPLQCFQQFQRELNPQLVNKKWTPVEDEHLVHLVSEFGDRNFPDIAASMPSRTDRQCYARWSKSLNPQIRHGRWKYTEDLRLLLAVKAYGATNWNLIARHIPGRTDVKCRERWIHVLAPQVAEAGMSWSLQEVEMLKELVKYHGSQWTLIGKELSENFGTKVRTDKQCKFKWLEAAAPAEKAEYQRVKELKSSDLPSGRRKLSALKPEDIVAHEQEVDRMMREMAMKQVEEERAREARENQRKQAENQINENEAAAAAAEVSTERADDAPISVSLPANKKRGRARR